MTTKEKYELFDKTKINEKVLGILKNMQESSKNFTDESVNSKIDSALDKLIENFRANKPEALLTLPEAKKEVKKEKEKAIKKNEGKDFSDKKDTDDKTGLPKKDTLEERKDIIKEESETEKEARDRAKKELEKEKEKAKDEVESQIEKLNRIIMEDPALRGFNQGSSALGGKGLGGKSNPLIDAERKALPRGSRVSQKGWKNQYGASDGGRKYYENRENRTDRKSPDYETGKPYLAKGGNVYSSDEMYLIAMFKGDVDLDTISIRAKNKAEARMIFEDTYRDKYENELGDFNIEIYVVKPFPKSDSYAQGGVIKAVEGVDLFEDYDDQPEEVQAILANYEMEDNDYETLQNLKAELESIGYTMEFGLDAEPYDLRKIGEKGKSEFYAKGGFMADGGMVNRKELNKKIKDYYIKTYPTDKEGKEINDKITFKRFWAYLSQGYNVYEVLEVADSLIRERVFEKLSEIYAVDYDVVYNMWLRSDKYDKGGQMADGGEVDKRILEKVYESYDIYKDGTNREHYNDFDNIEKVKQHIEERTGMKVLGIKAIGISENYPDNSSDPYDYDTYLFEIVKGQRLKVQRRYGRPNWSGNVAYDNTIQVLNLYADGGEMAHGGETDGKYTEYEMVVLSKDADGKSHKYRFLISARNMDEAKQSATDGWHSEFGDMGETFYKVMTDSKYRMDYGMADGGELNGNLYRVGYLKVYENDEEGDIVYTKEIYGDSEEDVSSKFKKNTSQT
jgi:hypothetical protein